MTQSDSFSWCDGPKVVAVTGASGFIGSHVCQNLVQHGYTVRACVRENTPKKTAHLLAMNKIEEEESQNGGRLEICVADMKTPGAYDEIFEGCTVIFHVAGSFGTDPSWLETVSVKGRKPPIDQLFQDIRREKGLLEEDGEPTCEDSADTLSYDHGVYNSYLLPLENLLDSARKSTTVRRIIYTSSGAAGGVIRDRDPEGFDLDEAICGNAYGRAKKNCERRLYQFGKETQASTKPITCASSCPCIVIGPLMMAPLHDMMYQHRLADMVAGRYTMFEDEWDIADVRDIADTQRRMAEWPDLVNGSRFWNGWEPMWPVLNVLKFVKDTFPSDYRIQPKLEQGSSEIGNDDDNNDDDGSNSASPSSNSEDSFGESQWESNGCTKWSNPVDILNLPQRKPETTILDTVQSLLDHDVVGLPHDSSFSDLCNHYTYAEMDGVDEELNYLRGEIWKCYPEPS